MSDTVTRQRNSALQPKCKCGNCLSLDYVKAGKTLCPRCERPELDAGELDALVWAIEECETVDDLRNQMLEFISLLKGRGVL